MRDYGLIEDLQELSASKRDSKGRFIKGHCPSPIQREKMSKAQLKNPNRYWKGKMITPAMRQALAESAKSRTGSSAPNWRGGVTPQYKQRRSKALKSCGQSHSAEQWLTLKKDFLYMCLCCKRCEPDIVLTKDHIIPVSLGGSDGITNIQPLCKSCNSRKHTKEISYISQYYEIKQ